MNLGLQTGLTVSLPTMLSIPHSKQTLFRGFIFYFTPPIHEERKNTEHYWKSLQIINMIYGTVDRIVVSQVYNRWFKPQVGLLSVGCVICSHSQSLCGLL